MQVLYNTKHCSVFAYTHYVTKSILNENAESHGLDVSGLRELAYLKCLMGFPHVVPLLGYSVTVNRIRLKLARASMNLAQYIKMHPQLPSDLPTIKSILFQVCQGLYYAKEKHHIIHRDIKPSNILITSTEGSNTQGSTDKISIVIADWGLASIYDRAYNALEWTEVTQTLPYRAPETLCYSSEYMCDQSKMDIWSIGILLLDLLRESKPFHGKLKASTNQDQLKRIFQFMGVTTEEYESLWAPTPYAPLIQKYANRPSQLLLEMPDPVTYHFLSQCLSTDYRTRLGLGDLLIHPFFTGLVLTIPMKSLTHQQHLTVLSKEPLKQFLHYQGVHFLWQCLLLKMNASLLLIDIAFYLFNQYLYHAHFDQLCTETDPQVICTTCLVLASKIAQLNPVSISLISNKIPKKRILVLEKYIVNTLNGHLLPVPSLRHYLGAWENVYTLNISTLFSNLEFLRFLMRIILESVTVPLHAIPFSGKQNSAEPNGAVEPRFVSSGTREPLVNSAEPREPSVNSAEPREPSVNSFEPGDAVVETMAALLPILPFHLLFTNHTKKGNLTR